MYRKQTLLWFILGLCSKLQVIASLSVTEIIVLSAAPFIFLKNHEQMKRDGVMPLFILSLLVILGCAIASYANHTPPEAVLRGMAVTCIVSCSVVVSHWMLRRDPGGFKWFVLAAAISSILSTFIFQTAVDVSMYGENAEDIMNGPIYWISRISNVVMVPVKGWYLHTPTSVCALIPLFVALFSLLTSVSGRSAALGALGFVALVLIGGKSRKAISRISRNFGIICGIGVLLIGLFYVGYKFSASQGLLGEEALQKYEAQTHGGQGGIGRLILGGRGDSFIGLLACRDKPIIGWGPWALDTMGYTEEFLTRFGTYEDVVSVYKVDSNLRNSGNTARLIHCHAYITEFWVWYGLWGLVFWIYVIFVLLRYLKQDVAAVPQWYAWLACSIPGMSWGIFFSPFADRFGIPLFIVACLMARAVRLGSFQLPSEMILEIEKAERK